MAGRCCFSPRITVRETGVKHNSLICPVMPDMNGYTAGWVNISWTHNRFRSWQNREGEIFSGETLPEVAIVSFTVYRFQVQRYTTTDSCVFQYVDSGINRQPSLRQRQVEFLRRRGWREVSKHSSAEKYPHSAIYYTYVPKCLFAPCDMLQIPKVQNAPSAGGIFATKCLGCKIIRYNVEERCVTQWVPKRFDYGERRALCPYDILGQRS